jgi:hypothetical protein
MYINVCNSQRCKPKDAIQTISLSTVEIIRDAWKTLGSSKFILTCKEKETVMPLLRATSVKNHTSWIGFLHKFFSSAAYQCVSNTCQFSYAQLLCNIAVTKVLLTFNRLSIKKKWTINLYLSIDWRNLRPSKATTHHFRICEVILWAFTRSAR